MSASVRISAKAARELLGLAESALDHPNAPRGPNLAVEAIRSALDGLRRKSEKKRPRREAKAKKVSAKGDETKAIRYAIFERAKDKIDGLGWHCEACFWPLGPPDNDADHGEMDHFFGRGREPQTERNCWVLCRNCHREKTANKPTAAQWLEMFLEHAHKHGYQRETNRAQRRLESLGLIDAAGEIIRGERNADLVITAKNPTIDLGPMRAALSRKEGA